MKRPAHKKSSWSAGGEGGDGFPFPGQRVFWPKKTFSEGKRVGVGGGGGGGGGGVSAWVWRVPDSCIMHV
eukprot:COSAG01_NODE_53885_length_336_cov_0.599156_1_plen_69_part_10